MGSFIGVDLILFRLQAPPRRRRSSKSSLFALLLEGTWGAFGGGRAVLPAFKLAGSCGLEDRRFSFRSGQKTPGGEGKKRRESSVLGLGSARTSVHCLEWKCSVERHVV